MENSKHAVLRKLFTGTEQSSNPGESSNRWGKMQRAGKSSSNGTAAVPAGSDILGRGIPVTGSVRERAKAFEERYAVNSNAYVPAPTPPGSAGQRPVQRLAKTSGDGIATAPRAAPSESRQCLSYSSASLTRLAAPAPAALSQQPLHSPAVDVRRQQAKTSQREVTKEQRRETSVLTSKTAFPPQTQSPGKRGSVYELPAASPNKIPASSPRNNGAGNTPLRADKRVSSPPSQHNHANEQSAKPTLRAGAFQAARTRSNSTPRASEWYTAASPKSNQPAATQTRSEIVQRPAARPQSMIASSPDDRRNSLRVSALPISRSRKSSASLEGLDRTTLDSPKQATPPPRPPIPQRSVSAHPNVITRPVKDNDASTSPVTAHQRPRDSAYMQVPFSAKSEPVAGASMAMERAKSASVVQTVDNAPKSSTRPRSLTLTAKNPAELDSVFQEFIVSLLMMILHTHTHTQIRAEPNAFCSNRSIFRKLFRER